MTEPNRKSERTDKDGKPGAKRKRDLKLAGGMEGGMPAGNAGGPGESDANEVKSGGKPNSADS